MAVEIFMKLEGITGGSRNYHHQGWSDVFSWQWGLERVGDGAQQGAANATVMNEISLVKAVGIDSPALMTLLAEGKSVKTAEITVVPVVGKREAQQKYVSLLLEDVRITSIMTDGSTEQSFFKERITLNFGKVRYEYNQYADAGPTPGAATAKTYAFGWDVAANAAC